jgi:hypothetical protein
MTFKMNFLRKSISKKLRKVIEKCLQKSRAMQADQSFHEDEKNEDPLLQAHGEYARYPFKHDIMGIKI